MKVSPLTTIPWRLGFQHTNFEEGKRQFSPHNTYLLLTFTVLEVLVLGDLERQGKKRSIFESQEGNGRNIFPETSKEGQNKQNFQLMGTYDLLDVRSLVRRQELKGYTT
jgi:hypothetical protein